MYYLPVHKDTRHKWVLSLTVLLACIKENTTDTQNTNTDKFPKSQDFVLLWENNKIIVCQSSNNVTNLVWMPI